MNKWLILIAVSIVLTVVIQLHSIYGLHGLAKKCPCIAPQIEQCEPDDETLNITGFCDPDDSDDGAEK